MPTAVRRRAAAARDAIGQGQVTLGVPQAILIHGVVSPADELVSAQDVADTSLGTDTGSQPSLCTTPLLVGAAPVSGLACAPGLVPTLQLPWARILGSGAGEDPAVTDPTAPRAQARERAQRRAAARSAEQRQQARRLARRRAAREHARKLAAEQRAERRREARQRAERRSSIAGKGWRNAPIVTWYGPGFYGNRTACGVRYTRTIVGVAHRTLPCGTLVQFRWHGITAVAPVIDRGPFASSDYVFDFSAALSCEVFKPSGIKNACFTRHDVKYRVVGRVNLRSYLRRQ